ncbi:MAG: glycine cleavage system protein H [Candidatus Lokiarchaeota archaeon]|nr:glycine cleavage system protein H [Candidatus Lokiarchaeota archaeon]
MATIEGYEFPDNLYYNEHSLWAKIDGNNIAWVGITDLARKHIEEITYIDVIFEEGEIIKLNRPFGTIESGKGSITLYSPISGEIIEINEELQDQVNQLKEDCYGKGWLIKVKPTNLNEDLDILMKSGTEKLQAWAEKELDRINKMKDENK